MWWWTALIPFAIQGLAIFFDESVFHIKRGLPKWERIGHPLDTLTVIACMAYVIWVPFSSINLVFYSLLAVFSTLFITKDEFVHNEHCPPMEQWIHALLFIIHPITLLCAGLIWPVAQGIDLLPSICPWQNHRDILNIFLKGQLVAMTLFMFYQIIFWNLIWKESHGRD